MPYKVLYHNEALEDLKGLGLAVRKKIIRAIETRLIQAPDAYGKPLRYSLKGLWSLRAGDYRIIYRRQGKEVLVLRIGHRKEVYEE
jgi:mRNA interferase RelE/StbE